jgi:alpha-ketoglutarate-dependent taurine dioxygenase
MPVFPEPPAAKVHFDVRPLDATFGAAVTGIRLSDVTDEQFAALYATWLHYALLIFPGQHLTRDEQEAFARRFGPLEFPRRRSATSVRTVPCAPTRTTTS